MKHYLIRYSISQDRVTEIKADSPEEARKIFEKDNYKYPTTRCDIVFSEGANFNYLTELDVNGDDIEGSEFYG